MKGRKRKTESGKGERPKAVKIAKRDRDSIDIGFTVE